MVQQVLEESLQVMRDCDSWPELKQKLQETGLWSQLAPGEADSLLDAWQALEAWRTDDHELEQDMRQWARGRGYADHLKGFRALPPAVLVEAARRRGWFVRDIGSGWVVNPPGGTPIHLRNG